MSVRLGCQPDCRTGLEPVHPLVTTVKIQPQYSARCPNSVLVVDLTVFGLNFKKYFGVCRQLGNRVSDCYYISDIWQV